MMTFSRTAFPLASHSLKQRGMSMVSLLIAAVVGGFLFIMAMKAWPAWSEYMTIQSTVKRVIAAAPSNATDAQKSFDQFKQVEYGITSISGKDIIFTGSGANMKASFSYEKEVELGGPVFLLFKFDGGS